MFKTLHWRCRPRASVGLCQRSGIAAVEVAICLPVLVLVVFGSIEMSSRIYSKQAGTAAAYEAIRVATSTGGTEAAARQRATEVLAALNIQGATIAVTPPIDASMRRGTLVTVSVDIPSSLNSGGLGFLFPTQIVADVTMVKQ